MVLEATKDVRGHEVGRGQRRLIMMLLLVAAVVHVATATAERWGLFSDDGRVQRALAKRHFLKKTESHKAQPKRHHKLIKRAAYYKSVVQ